MNTVYLLLILSTVSLILLGFQPTSLAHIVLGFPLNISSFYVDATEAIMLSVII